MAPAATHCRRRRADMRAPSLLLLLLLSATAAVCAATAATAVPPPPPVSVRSLKAAMYPTHRGSGGCYKLLHARGESGCWSAAHGSLLAAEDAPLAMWPPTPPAQPPSASALHQPPIPSSPVVLVALAGDSPDLLARLARGHADLSADTDDARLARVVRGVLVVDRAAAAAAEAASSSPAIAPPSRYTALPPFPYGAEYAPAGADKDPSQAYAWNPEGLPELDPLRFRLPVPVIAVPGATAGAAASSSPDAAALAFARDALRRAASNDAAAATAGSPTTATGRSRARHRASLSLGMTARGNASACLEQGSCKPLGGFSVLAVLPPRAPAASDAAASEDQDPPPATRRRRGLRAVDEVKEEAATEAGAPSSSSSSSSARQPPLVLVVAQTDGYDLFHDLIRGSDSPLSGLIAMLAASYALRESAKTAAAAAALPLSSSSSAWPSLFSARVAFLALAGEPWGYMGSRRLLYELESGNATWARAVLGPGASPADVSAVIEIGQVGRAAEAAVEGGGEGGKSNNPSSNKRRQFFLHTRGDGGSSEEARTLPFSLTQAFQQAAEGAANATVAARPSEEKGGQRGLPPSSLYSFSRVLQSSPAQVPLAFLAEFDDRMDARNPYFGGGRFDAGVKEEKKQEEEQEQHQRGGTLDVASVSSAALLLASALRQLALPPSAPAPNPTAVRALVESYASCLAADVPGLACPMAGALMGPDAGPGAAGAGPTTGGGAAPPTIPPPPRYVGVLQALPTPQPYGRELASPARKDPLARFVWGALVASTMVEEEKDEADASSALRCTDAAAAERCVASGRVCAAPPPTADSVFFGGPCVNASARYVPSYSLRVACAEGCNGSSGGDSTAAPAFRWGEARGAAAAAAGAWMQRYGWPEDPMWTESDWPYGVPSVQLYLADAPGAEAAALVVGVVATAAATAGGWWLRRRLIRAHVYGLVAKR